MAFPRWVFEGGGVMAVAAAVLAAVPEGRADVLYSQGFDVPSATGSSGNTVNTYGWAAHMGATGTNSLTWNPDPLNANQGNQLRVVADVAGAPSPPNRIFAYGAPTDKDMLTWTENAGSISLAGSTALTISWRNRNDASGSAIRAAVRVNTGSTNRWFASNPPKTHDVWTQETADLRASTWIEFNFNGTLAGHASGAFDVAGTAGPLPSGTMTAAGLYLELKNAKAARIDSFVIEGAPPPPKGTVVSLR